jgi:hypothetical protein
LKPLGELQNLFPDIGNIPDRREMETHIILNQLVVEGDIEKEKKRLQRMCDDAR